MFKRARRVRLHLKPGIGPEAFEGVQRGRRPVGGFHVLEAPKVHVDEATSYTMDGARYLEVPAGDVLCREVL